MRVLVLGGGYAGLLTARKLERSLPDDVELVLVDDTGDHLVQHELHRVVRAPAFADAINLPLADLLDRAAVRTATVTGLDRDERTVSLADGDTLDYDVCVVALGAETDFYGLDGVRANATPLKRLEDAHQIREDFLSLDDDATVVVGGAGLSGVQVAGELAAFADAANVADGVDVVLLEQRSDVAPTFPENFRDAVRRLLREQGVEVRTDTPVDGADGDAVHLASGDPLPYDQFVWTGGVTGTAALDGDRPRVRADLALDDRTFVAGDAASVVDADGQAVPASAQAAVRAADVAAHNVAETVAAERSGDAPRLDKWTFESRGWLVSVGDDAVAQLGPEVFTGRAARLVKSSLGVTYLAEHGSLREALRVLREDVEGSAALFGHLPDDAA